MCIETVLILPFFVPFDELPFFIPLNLFVSVTVQMESYNLTMPALMSGTSEYAVNIPNKGYL